MRCPRHIEQIRCVLDSVELTEPERFRIEAVLARPDLSSERAWDLRAALHALDEAQDRLRGAQAKLNAVLGTHSAASEWTDARKAAP